MTDLQKYRVVKQNLQVVKLVDSEHVNKNMVQNSSPTCKHNLFTLIQSKNFLLQWCSFENQNDPIYEVNDLFLT